MGYVIRCRGVQHGAVAWKLPRMIADTQRENVFIAQHLEVERSNVGLIAGRSLALVRPLIINNPLEYETLGILPVDADPNLHMPEQRVLVRFSKGKPPRFCGVSRPRNGGIRVVPEGAMQLQKAEDWEHLVRFAATNRDGNGKVHPGFLSDPVNPAGGPGAPSTGPEFALLPDAVEREAPRSGWYLGLPSIVYDWAAGTLQDVISNRRLTGWTTVQHLTLVERILSGLNTLHQAGMLHGDLRTANIMYIVDPSDPDNYVIIDCAALSGRSGMVGQAPTEGGDKTIMGPIANPRQSPFFAPERRQAFEHEAGDIAIVAIDPRDGESLIVATGWRSRLHDAAGTRDLQSPSGPAIATLVQEFARALGTLTAELGFTNGHGHTRLRAGDRIRLREYVFDVLEIAPRLVEGFTVMRCKAGVAKVCNERLAVMLPDFWSEFKHAEETRTLLMSLPKLTEIYQWSHATDLFSVGVLALYSVYAQNPEQPGRGDAEFGELLGALANPLYFNSMWKSLEDVCRNLERIVAENPGIATRDLGAKASGMPTANGSSDSGTIYRACLTFVQHITQTAPYAQQLLVEGFKGNIAEFLLFIHFVFSCLHRRSDLGDGTYELAGEPLRPFPFCVDRTSRDPSATEHALKRARFLRDLFTRDIFRDMRASADDLPKYLPMSHPELILEKQRLEQELERARADINHLAEQLDSLKQVLSRMSAERNLLKEERDRLKHECERLGEERDELRKEVDGSPMGSVRKFWSAALTTWGALKSRSAASWNALREARSRRPARKPELTEAAKPAPETAVPPIDLAARRTQPQRTVIVNHSARQTHPPRAS